MNNEQWQLFSDQVSLNLTNNQTPLNIQTPESLESIWHKIQNSIITAALQHIPNKKFTVRNFQHIFSTKASKLHHYLKKLGNIIRQTKHALQHSTPIPSHHNQLITYINTSCNLNIPFLPAEHNLLTNWLGLAKNEWKTLYHTRNIENIKEIKQQIDNNITKRCNKLQTNPTSMINSILNRHKDPVKFDNIRTDNDLITDAPNIKLHIQQHFDQ
jgi:hypothetical protein